MKDKGKQFDDDKPRKLPKRFRSSLDQKDKEAHARLLENDAIQKELGEKINQPFTANTPLQRMMSKAFITIATLEAAGNFSSDFTIEQLAEAYATVGRYDDAAAISKANKELYSKYWEAVWLDDDKWCEHVDKHKYIREHIWSKKENCAMPLLACNICGTWNALDAPDHLTKQKQTADDIHHATRGMSMDEVKIFLQENHK